MADPACVLKWGWSTIMLETGRTSSCHRTNKDFIADPEGILDFHNTPIKIETRQKMLEGKWPGRGCEYCKNIEAAGGISDRMDFNHQLIYEGRERLVPPELLSDPRAVRVSPTIVEVYFSNLCNLGCIYCKPIFSSVLENEWHKYGIETEKLKFLSELREKYPQMLEKFWIWLEKNVQTIDRYHILGGEPFYQPELEKNIDFFEKNPAPKLNLKIFSNLKVNPNKFNTALTKLANLKKNNHLRSVGIICSLDCWGPQQEYIRTGLDINAWEKNFAALTQDYDDFEIEVHATMTSMSIKTMADLVEKINHYNQYRKDKSKIYLTCNIAFDPDCMHPGIFPEGFFDQDFDKIVAAMSDPGEIEIIKGYQKTINNTDHNPELIRELKKELDGFDSRRNTDWKSVFPWLVDVE